MSRKNPILTAENIGKWSKRGPETLGILSGISLEIFAGELVGLVGPSGSGKSTLLHILGGMLRADSGEVMRNGRSAIVFQSAYLLPYLSVRENVELPRMFGRNRDLSLPWHEALKRVHLESFANRSVQTLSRGEAQRVSIARAFVLDPSLLLLDEPTANLDAEAAASLMALVSELVHKGSLGALLATHDLEMAARCDRLLYLESGKLVSKERSSLHWGES
jgi:ABC-type lipoprotein export system ATPase subunit